MNLAEPEGCFYEWGDHSCLLDLHHNGPHECSDGAEQVGGQGVSPKARCQACQRFARTELHTTGLWLCGKCAAWSDEHARLNEVDYTPPNSGFWPTGTFD